MSGDGKVDVQALAVEMLQGKQDSSDTLDDSSESTTVESESNEESESNSGEESKPSGGHPAWKEILSVLPEEYQQAITPKLKEWDAGVTKRFQEIHSQYEPLKDFEPLLTQGLDADTFSQAVGLYQALNSDPEAVYKALGEAYGFVAEQESEDDEDDYSEIPKAIQEQLARQERALEYMAEQLQEQKQAEQQYELQTELENYMEGLRDSYGDFDEDYVLTKIANGEDGEVAVRRYQEITGTNVPKLSTKTAPKVLGTSSGVGSGGVPTTALELSKLSDKDTRSLVEQALRAASQT